MNVFYDPSKTDTATLLQLIKNRNCSNARHVTDAQGHALNPIIAPGDPVQFQIKSAKPLELSAESQLPPGWQFAGQASGGEEIQIVTLTTPKNTRQGNVDIELRFTGGESIKTQIAVVQQIGKH